MNSTTEIVPVDTPFPPGSFVHPTRHLGHLAHVLMAVAPENVGRPPKIGFTYAVIVCPQFSLPAGFPFMSPAEQRAIIKRLEAVQVLRTDTLTAAENVGLKLISDEWMASHYSDPAHSEPENTGSDTETGTSIIVP